MGEFGVERATALFEFCLQIPITSAAKGTTGTLTLHQKTHSNRLHPTRRKSPGNLFPEQRRQGVANKPIKDAPGFLGMNELHVQIACLIKGFRNCLFGDLVKHHPFHRHLG